MSETKHEASVETRTTTSSRGTKKLVIRLLVVLVLVAILTGSGWAGLQSHEGRFPWVTSVMLPSWDAKQLARHGQKSLPSGFPLLRLSGSGDDQTTVRAELDKAFFIALAEEHLKQRYPSVEDAEEARRLASGCLALLPKRYQEELSSLAQKLTLPVTELLLLQQSFYTAPGVLPGFVAAQHRRVVLKDQSYVLAHPPKAFPPVPSWPMRVEQVQPPDRLGFVSLAPVGMLGVLLGCNDAKICGMVLDGPDDTPVLGVPLTLALRAALENGPTLSMAQQTLDSLTVSHAGTVVLMDDKGMMIAAEIKPTGKTYRYGKNNLLVADESFVNPMWPDARTTERHARLEKKLTASSWLGPKEWKNLAVDPWVASLDGPSVILNVEAGMWWLPDAQGQWHKLRVRDFFTK